MNYLSNVMRSSCESLNTATKKVAFRANNTKNESISLERTPEYDSTNFGQISKTIYSDEIYKTKRNVQYERPSKLKSDYTMKGNGFDVKVDIGMVHEPTVKGNINGKDVDLKLKGHAVLNWNKGEISGTIDNKPVKISFLKEEDNLNIPKLQIEGTIPAENQDMIQQLALLMFDRIDKAKSDAEVIAFDLLI